MLGAFYESTAARGLDYGAQFDPLIASLVGGDASMVALVKGLIARESFWNPGAFRWEARLNEGSVGLMQVLPSTGSGVLGRPLTTSDLFVPDTNLRAGVGYLLQQIGRYGMRDGISAYNAGRPIVGNQPYVDDVLTYQVWYMNHLPAVTGGEGIGEPDVWVTVGGGGEAWALTEETTTWALGALLLVGAALLLPRRRAA